MRKLFFLLIFCLTATISAYACDSTQCTLSREAVSASGAGQSGLFADVSIEQFNWDSWPAREAHLLHDQGHHVHNKTHEEFYHFTFGGTPTERLTVLAQIPYVVRGSVEIESHARLGRHESSEGWGDGNLTGIWRFVQEDSGLLGFLAGVKLPTGETEELNSAGVLFEPELQPGTGSVDATIGIVGQRKWGASDWRGNLRYTRKGKGEQDFRFGDAFDAHLWAGHRVRIDQRSELGLGADLEWKAEARQSQHGQRVEDSGGTTVLLGPAFEVNWAGTTVFGNILWPVYQHLGGVHQELDFVWNAGVKIGW